MKVNRVHAEIMLLAMAVLLSPFQAIGKEAAIGKVEKVAGIVTVVRSDNQEVRGEPGMPLFAGDQIITDKGAKAWFSLEQGRQFRLSEEAQVVIDELSTSEEEGSQPMMRLILGYLWSKLEKLGAKTATIEVHTPTAVMGVRGTEFDTVVALDASSVVAVDEGVVEVGVEDQRETVEQGKMLRVEMDAKPGPPESAVPKEKRDWEGWRKQRVGMLFKNLPQMAPKFTNRFNQSVARLEAFAERVNRKAEEVRKAIEEVRKAKAQGALRKEGQPMKDLRVKIQEFKGMVGKFREGLNRVRVMARLSQRLEGFVAENKTRFTAQQLIQIESNLKRISQERKEIKEVVMRTISNIRGTFKELKGLREEFSGKRAGKWDGT